MPTDVLNPTEVSLLIVHLGDQRLAVPLSEVERVMPMAYFLPLPGRADDVVGMLNLHGDVLPVVDPRRRSGLPTPPLSAEHSLVLLAGETRRLVWVDRVDDVTTATVVGPVARLGDTLLPLLTV